jgi:xanthine dehydrogenase accessory factor
VESAVAGEAALALRDGRMRRLRYGVTDEQAWSVGLPCGGAVEVVVKPVAPEGLARLRADVEARRPVILALDLDTGDERLLHPGDGEGNGDGTPAGLAQAARAALDAGRSEVWTGPGGEWFLRAFAPPVRLVLVGAVHVAQALAGMAEAAGFDVVVVDPRRAFATAERFCGVPIVAGWPAEALAGIGVDRRTAVVTLAHDPKIDDPALAAALRAGCFYVGALGSRRSHAARLGRLREQGFDEGELERIHGPVGLAIGAVTAGEIATSILAQLVERLRKG